MWHKNTHWSDASCAGEIDSTITSHLEPNINSLIILLWTASLYFLRILKYFVINFDISANYVQKKSVCFYLSNIYVHSWRIMLTKLNSAVEKIFWHYVIFVIIINICSRCNLYDIILVSTLWPLYFQMCSPSSKSGQALCWAICYLCMC